MGSALLQPSLTIDNDLCRNEFTFSLNRPIFSGMSKFKRIYLSLMLVVSMLFSALTPAIAAGSGLKIDPAFVGRVMGKSLSLMAVSPVAERARQTEAAQMPCHKGAANSAATTEISVRSDKIQAMAFDCLQCCFAAPKSLLAGVAGFHSIKQGHDGGKLKALQRFDFFERISLQAAPIENTAPPPISYLDLAIGTDSTLLIDYTQRFRL